jgi:hypothetical protein
MTFAATRPSSFLKLKGEPYEHVFEVKIGNEESVAALKKAIKEEKRPNTDHIPADSLVLWNVSAPYNPTLTDNVDTLRLLDDGRLPQVSDEQIQSLLPVRKLSEFFLEASYRRSRTHDTSQTTASSINL